MRLRTAALLSASESALAQREWATIRASYPVASSSEWLLARAFACRPTILFADEPTGNLDTGTGGKINDLLFALNEEEGTTLVLVTHEKTLAARCSRTLELQGGRQLDAANTNTAGRGA